MTAEEELQLIKEVINKVLSYQRNSVYNVPYSMGFIEALEGLQEVIKNKDYLEILKVEIK